MKARVLLIAILLISPTAAFAQKDAPLKTKTDKYSYMLGLMFGKNLRFQEAEVDPDILMAGIYDGYKGTKPKISEEELPKLQASYDEEANTKVGSRLTKEGESLLAANKKKQGVQVTKSGLQYEVLKAGKGPKVQKTDTVKAHYVGTFANGVKFDSSYDRSEPIIIGVGDTVPGWQEALQLMSAGTKLKLVLPPALGYGEKGNPPYIPPNAVLVFDMELLAINPPEAAADK
jgi:FKBP-type peptidyl-prolyl cis-trans isomerase